MVGVVCTEMIGKHRVVGTRRYTRVVWGTPGGGAGNIGGEVKDEVARHGTWVRSVWVILCCGWLSRGGSHPESKIKYDDDTFKGRYLLL